MQIYYELILFDTGPERSRTARKLKELGYAFDADGIFKISVDQDDPMLRTWMALADDLGAPMHAGTRFDAKDRNHASHLKVSPAWLNGYPQPIDDWGYKSATYDVEAQCPSCGLYNEQVAPFRLVGEPKWGTRQVMGLNWVFDEIFVRPEIWKAVFAPAGVECRPVLGARGDDPLQTVKQLDIPTLEGESLVMSPGAPAETCAACGKAKYQPHRIGFFPSLRIDPGLAMFKVAEWFGSGGVAFHPIIVNQELRRTILDSKLRRLDFWPLRG